MNMAAPPRTFPWCTYAPLEMSGRAAHEWMREQILGAFSQLNVVCAERHDPSGMTAFCTEDGSELLTCMESGSGLIYGTALATRSVAGLLALRFVAARLVSELSIYRLDGTLIKPGDITAEFLAPFLLPGQEHQLQEMLSRCGCRITPKVATGERRSVSIAVPKAPGFASCIGLYQQKAVDNLWK